MKFIFKNCLFLITLSLKLNIFFGMISSIKFLLTIILTVLNWKNEKAINNICDDIPQLARIQIISVYVNLLLYCSYSKEFVIGYYVQQKFSEIFTLSN